MAEEKKAEGDKKSPISVFRDKLQNKEALKETVLEGLKSTNAKVRSLASKMAFRFDDHAFIKTNVLPLINSDKSKKVLRALSEKITRKPLIKKVNALLVAKSKKAPVKEAAAAAAPAKTAAPKES